MEGARGVDPVVVLERCCEKPSSSGSLEVVRGPPEALLIRRVVRRPSSDVEPSDDDVPLASRVPLGAKYGLPILRRSAAPAALGSPVPDGVVLPSDLEPGPPPVDCITVSPLFSCEEGP